MDNPQLDDQEFLTNIIKSLVTVPDSVLAKRTVDKMGVLIQFWVAKADMPFLIGRYGDNIKALRQIARMVGYRSKSNISLKIEEPA